MSEQPQDRNDQNTDLDELNDQGVGGTVGEDSSFEPEEDETSAEK